MALLLLKNLEFSPLRAEKIFNFAIAHTWAILKCRLKWPGLLVSHYSRFWSRLSRVC